MHCCAERGASASPLRTRCCAIRVKTGPSDVCWVGGGVVLVSEHGFHRPHDGVSDSRALVSFPYLCPIGGMQCFPTLVIK